ncbi:MAG: flavodoxin family protein [Acidimicrobiia bacterium]|nr:flavodoxin family protein [Acidimicrobiia bacterium]
MRALVVWAHPQLDSFSGALCRTATSALERAGHDVEVLDLYRDGFDPVMSREEWQAYRRCESRLDEVTGAHAAAVAAAELLVFVYPTWWSGLPAILKGWLERVLVPGVAFEVVPGKGIRPRLTDLRHLVGVSTYGATRPAILLQGDAGRRMVLRSLRLSCGPRCRSTWLGLYDIERTTRAQRAAFLARVDAVLGDRPRPPCTTLRPWRARAGATAPAIAPTSPS